MYLFKKVRALQDHLNWCRERGLKIGFTPTMGALHEGHLSLVQQSLRRADVNVCSIFVNPTQFNEASDLDKYPRTTAADIELLTSVGNQVLFLPEVSDIYPEQLDTSVDFDFNGLDEVLEGQFRPGHFAGVVQVVKRLLDIVQPDFLFMGQKDYQQLSIIRSMLQQLGSPVELVMCPIVREESGLAMSSRNVRLPEEARRKAALIHEVLQQTRANIENQSPEQLAKAATDRLVGAGFEPEYFSIV
ncbi:MAG: pantoate--beta-alanine ligase, partial [Bacteroidota bacterium]